MLKKIAAYFFIAFGLFALWASTSRTAMQYVADHRDVNTWWGSYQCLHGDLIGMAYLDFVSTFRQPGNAPHFDHPALPGRKKTVLYLHGDSYAWTIPDSIFSNVTTFHCINRDRGGYYHLDTTKRNVLVIEIAERMTRDYFKDSHMISEFRDSSTVSPKIAAILFPLHDDIAAMPGVSIDDLFNKFINQNLEGNLFNYNFIMPMFEYKAVLNYELFNRASGDVVISDNKQYLLLKATASQTDPCSSYIPISDKNIDQLNDTLNKIHDHYIASGFDDVYFSIIPSTATIIQPNNYNGLIPRVYQHPGLKMKVIDIYTPFKKDPDAMYCHGDTHWNLYGQSIWVDLLWKDIAEPQQAH